MKPIKTNDLAALGAVLVRRNAAVATEAYNARVRNGQNAKTQPAKKGLTAPPNALKERRLREENNNRIKKLASIIKRQDPRLYTEALQAFPHELEGLNSAKQVEFIKRLETIRKEYRL